MSRASMRMKQYRPMSADFSKVGTLSSVFGLNPEQNKGNSSNGVLLINCKSHFLIYRQNLNRGFDKLCKAKRGGV